MSPLGVTRGVSSRFTPTFRYWKDVAGANVPPTPPVDAAVNVVTGTGTSVPILRLVFLPSAARSRGAARIFELPLVWRKRARTVDGRVTRKSAALIDDRRWARMLTFVCPTAGSSF